MALDNATLMKLIQHVEAVHTKLEHDARLAQVQRDLQSIRLTREQEILLTMHDITLISH